MFADMATTTSGFAHFKHIVMMLAATFCLAKASEVRSEFTLVKSQSAIDLSVVNKTYTGTTSSLNCAMTCTGPSIASFYYVRDTSTCYCNSQHDSGVVEAGADFTMIYGYQARRGNASECQTLFDEGHRTDGEFTTSSGTQISCNLTSLGWVVFQRRQDGSVDFYRNWTAYVEGFGNPDGEFWLGLDKISNQTEEGGCELHIYLEAEPNETPPKGYARYSNFSVGSSATNYRLQVEGFSGNVDDCFLYHDGNQFSTYDVDNDRWDPGNCAQGRSAWWHDACSYSHLNGKYLAGHYPSGGEVDGILWSSPWGFYYSLLRTEMAFRCPTSH